MSSTADMKTINVVKDNIESIVKEKTDKDKSKSKSSKVPPLNMESVSKSDAKETCLLYTSPSPRDVEESRMPSSA